MGLITSECLQVFISTKIRPIGRRQCVCLSSWTRTYDPVRQADEAVIGDGRSALPHLVDQVDGDGREAEVAGGQIDVEVLVRF